jgi:phage/plasmid-like protein (TIGR03299 family)
MAHDISIRADGFAEMAYVGQLPWHGLGQVLTENDSIDDWREAAGLDWTVQRSPVQFMNGSMHTWPQNEVLYRSDTNDPLAVVSNRYNVVQPQEVLEFFRDLVSEHGFKLETAGSLKGGRRIWALARTGFDGDVVANDRVNTYLLLVTSCDGGLATTAKFTSVRVVCRNTLQMGMWSAAETGTTVKVRHSTVFDPTAVKGSLGLNANIVFDKFMGKMKSFAEKSLSGQAAAEVIERLFASSGSANLPVREIRGFKTVMQLFNGAGKGSTMDGVAGTGWGLVNAVTEYADFHIRAKNQDNRLNSAWFGEGANLKDRIVDLVEMV